MSAGIPKYPTHAVKFYDNWDGEGSTYYVFAYEKDGDYLCWDNGEPLIQYEGDEILAVCDLSQEKAPE